MMIADILYDAFKCLNRYDLDHAEMVSTQWRKIIQGNKGTLSLRRISECVMSAKDHISVHLVRRSPSTNKSNMPTVGLGTNREKVSSRFSVNHSAEMPSNQCSSSDRMAFKSELLYTMKSDADDGETREFIDGVRKALDGCFIKVLNLDLAFPLEMWKRTITRITCFLVNINGEASHEYLDAIRSRINTYNISVIMRSEWSMNEIDAYVDFVASGRDCCREDIRFDCITIDMGLLVEIVERLQCLSEEDHFEAIPHIELTSNFYYRTIRWQRLVSSLEFFSIEETTGIYDKYNYEYLGDDGRPTFLLAIWSYWKNADLDADNRNVKRIEISLY